MALFDLLRRKPAVFFEPAETERIVAAVKQAELRTSGEVRVFVESKCRYVDAVDRAAEVFFNLKMDQTDDRNGTLVYVATKDRQVAVFGDQGIYQRLSAAFWDAEVSKMLRHFKQGNIAEGIIAVVNDIGEVLHEHFPYDNDTDKNELPDDIVFGK